MFFGNVDTFILNCVIFSRKINNIPIYSPENLKSQINGYVYLKAKVKVITYRGIEYNSTIS